MLRFWLLSLPALVACGDAFITIEEMAAGGSGGGGSGASGGSGQGAGPAGPGSGGSGAGPSDCTPGNCGPGKYCDVDQGVCTSCTNLGRLKFAPAEKLSALSAGTEPRFPRATADGQGLFYRLGPPNTSQLQVTDDYLTSGGGDLVGIGADEQASGPLHAPLSSAGILAGLDFFYDGHTEVSSNRAIKGGALGSMGLDTPDALPLPFNTAAGHNYSIAIASSRVWWMSTRTNDIPGLLTTDLTGEPAAAVVNVAVAPGCPWHGDDLAPWVEPAEGRFMLFQSGEQNDSCQGTSQTTDLYAVAMLDNGHPKEAASPLGEGINGEGTNETEPSMSVDLCYLFFASDAGGEFNIYRAQRR